MYTCEKTWACMIFNAFKHFSKSRYFHQLTTAMLLSQHPEGWERAPSLSKPEQCHKECTLGKTWTWLLESAVIITTVLSLWPAAIFDSCTPQEIEGRCPPNFCYISSTQHKNFPIPNQSIYFIYTYIYVCANVCSYSISKTGFLSHHLWVNMITTQSVPGLKMESQISCDPYIERLI